MGGCVCVCTCTCTVHINVRLCNYNFLYCKRPVAITPQYRTTKQPVTRRCCSTSKSLPALAQEPLAVVKQGLQLPDSCRAGTLAGLVGLRNQRGSLHGEKWGPQLAQGESGVLTVWQVWVSLNFACWAS